MTLTSRERLTGLCVAIAAMAVAVAQSEEFPSIYNSEEDQKAAPMSPAEAAANLQVPEGFRVSVFAAEPDVQNPIAMTWDARGRLWIAENYTYAERPQRFDLSQQDRVVIFEDADGDGVADKRTVFTDQVQMLTSVEVGHGGVWLMCPPRLLFLPDSELDDVPDGPAKVILDGFDVAKENYHNFANGLKWGPDGWLYGRCGGSCPARVGAPGTPEEQRIALEGGIWRFHPRTSHFEVLAHGTTNPWGHDWNEFGDGFFINTVNGHLWHLIPGAHFQRPFTLDPNAHVYELIDMHADHWHFDTGGSWTNSRDGAANSFGGGHAHSGMMIYLGDNWPDEYRGRLLTWNFHGRRANQELLTRDGSGYVAKHGQDMLLSADPFFRGIELSYGPDGAVYAIDWSDTGECHEHTGVHRTSGRIFRVVHKSVPEKRRDRVDLRSLDSRQLVELMKHRNEWYVRQARLILAERGAQRPSEAIRLLRRMVDESNSIEAYRALTTLHAMGDADSALIRRLFAHHNEHLRAWAIRLLTDHWPIDDIFGPPKLPEGQAARIDAECAALLDDLCKLAAGDESALVRLTLASVLQRMPVARRVTLATKLVEQEVDANDHNLPLLVWYGLIPVANTAPVTLANLATRSQWPKTQRLIARRLAERIEDHPGAVDALLGGAAEADAEVRHNLLAGISDGLKGWSRAPQPKHWERVIAAVASDDDDETIAMVRELSVLFGDGRALEEVRLLVLDKHAEVGVRRSALQTLVASGGDGVVEICLPLLADRRLNIVAAQGVTKSDDPKVAHALITNYYQFRAPHRPKVIEILVARPTFAGQLLNAIAAKRISAADLTAFDVRQIRSLNDSSLIERIPALWGEVRDSPEEKRQQIHDLKRRLTPEKLSTADLTQGRLLFNQSCAKCHKLFGQGESTGPDITGANRNNVDYLLENIVDPSGVVGKDFGMSIVRTMDGRVLNGLVVSKTDKTLTLQTQTDRQTIRLDDVVEMRKTSLSPMPDGLLDNLSEEQIRNLVHYLMQPAQVSLPQGPSP